MLLFGVFAAAARGQTGDGASAYLQAEAWYGRLALRIPENRDWVVLFFEWPLPKSPTGEQMSKKLQGCVEELNRLVERRRDLLIVGVTSARESELKRFFETFKPRFSVGVRSTSYRRFRVNEFPAVMILRPGSAAGMKDWEAGVPVSDPGLLAGLFPEDKGATPDPQDIENQDTDALKAEAMELVSAGDARKLDQFDMALELLRLRMEPAEFMDYCDRIEPLAQQASYFVGRIRFERHLADPAVEIKQTKEPPIARVLRDWRSNKEDPKWEKFRRFYDGFESRAMTAEDLLADYRRLLTDDPCDMLIRQWLPPTIKNRDEAALLPALLAMYDLEPDPCIRSRLVTAAGQLAPAGDPATLAFFEERLTTEKNIYWVQPVLEMLIQFLKDGVNRRN